MYKHVTWRKLTSCCARSLENTKWQSFFVLFYFCVCANDNKSNATNFLSSVFKVTSVEIRTLIGNWAEQKVSINVWNKSCKHASHFEVTSESNKTENCPTKERPEKKKHRNTGFYLFIDLMFIAFTCKPVIISSSSLLSTIIRSTSKVIRRCETITIHPFLYAKNTPSSWKRTTAERIPNVDPINWHSLWAKLRTETEFHQSSRKKPHSTSHTYASKQ